MLLHCTTCMGWQGLDARFPLFHFSPIPMFSSLDRKRSAPIPIPQNQSSSHPLPTTSESLPLKTLLVQLDAEIVDQQKVTFDKLNEYFKIHDISQQEFVGCWEIVNKYIHGPLHHEAISWVINCLKYHYQDCDLLRLDFFKVCTDCTKNDLSICIKLLTALTKDGRDLKNFEHDTARLLAEWVRTSVDQSNTVQNELVQLMVNIVKYSSIYIKESDMETMLLQLFKAFGVDRLHLSCISFIDAVIRYSLIPENSFTNCILQLCSAIAHPESQELASLVFQNIINTEFSTIACQNIIMILYQSEHSLEVLLGATQLAGEILEQKRQSSSHHFILSVI